MSLNVPVSLAKKNPECPGFLDLKFGRQLAQAVELAQDLVDHVAADWGIKAGEQVGPAGAVVGGFDSAHGAIDANSQDGDRVGNGTAEHVEGQLVSAAVAVGVAQPLGEGVDGVGCPLKPNLTPFIFQIPTPGHSGSASAPPGP